jgi:hypothetical protein
MAVTTAATVVVRWDSDVRGCGSVQAMQVLDIVASHLVRPLGVAPRTNIAIAKPEFQDFDCSSYIYKVWL